MASFAHWSLNRWELLWLTVMAPFTHPIYQVPAVCARLRADKDAVTQHLVIEHLLPGAGGMAGHRADQPHLPQDS